MNKKENSFLAQQEIAPCQPSTDFFVDGGGYAACGANAKAATPAETNRGIQNMESEKNQTAQTGSAVPNSISEKNGTPIANSNRFIPNAESQKNQTAHKSSAVPNSISENAGTSISNSNYFVLNAESQKNQTAHKKTSRALRFAAPASKRLAYLAVFVALSTVANGGAVTSQTSTLSFTYFTAFLAGTALGPFGGFVVGFLGDFLGCLLVPKGPYLILIGISSGLMGLIPGIVMNLKALDHARSRLSPLRGRLLTAAAIVFSMGLIALICTTCLNTLSLFLMYSSKAHTLANWLIYLSVRAPLQLPVVALNTAVIVFAFQALERDLKKIREKLK
jgi:ECF transporter S component (folate family)